MKLSRVSLAIMAVVVLSLGLVGTALADKSEQEAKTEQVKKGERGHKAATAHKADHAEKRKGKGIAGSVVADPSGTSFQVETKNGHTWTVAAEEAEFHIPGGKKVDGLITKAQDLRAGDVVAVRGERTGDDAFTATVVRLTGKTIKKFGGEVTAVLSSSITVQKDDEDEDGEVVTKTFSLNSTVMLPSGVTAVVGDKVRVIYRKPAPSDSSTNPTALGVVVKQEKETDREND